jgi:hypothetical protein
MINPRRSAWSTACAWLERSPFGDDINQRSGVVTRTPSIVCTSRSLSRAVQRMMSE